MTYAEFLALFERTYADKGASVLRPTERWRRGQTYFNVLNDVRPDLADSVRATEFDPFYRDDIIPAFLLLVATNW